MLNHFREICVNALTQGEADQEDKYISEQEGQEPAVLRYLGDIGSAARYLGDIGSAALVQGQVVENQGSDSDEEEEEEDTAPMLRYIHDKCVSVLFHREVVEEKSGSSDDDIPPFDTWLKHHISDPGYINLATGAKSGYARKRQIQ